MISRPRNGVLCFLGRKKPPERFNFVGAVSVMLGYSKYLDKAIEDGKKIPRWIAKSANLASSHLSGYRLDKTFF